ncbi:iron ABC transporter permease [Microvirga ossetica]|uniref:Iron ABC transporter permease n=1 Tax=Microvirga ossetica TaxID=1882682 RepID=A0A1B2ECW3_9HYPH|nr:iron ABC transporter permease [Microvirga ossetica]ANY77824.1 iron ABC transporter permease [Microvirga ossetica]
MRHSTPSRSFLERGGFGLLALVVLIVFAFDVLPAARLLLTALAPGGVFNPDAALAALSSRSALNAARATLETAFLSSLLALPLGVAMAFALGVTDMRGRRLVSFLFVLSVMISPQVMALAFLHLAGPASPILNTLGLAPEAGSANPMLGRGGIVLVMGLHHAPLVYVVMSAGLKRIPSAVVEAARIDGAHPMRIVTDHLLPLLRPHLVSAALLAFVAGIGNFGIPALLGAPVNYLTLPVLIYRRLSSFGTSILGDVAALGLLVAAIAIVCVAASQFLMRRSSVHLEEDAPLQPFWPLGRLRAPTEIVVALVIGVTLILPMLSLLTTALVPSYGMKLNLATITLDNFTEVLARQDVTIRAFTNSLLYAGGAACLLAVLSVLLAYGLVRLMAYGRTAAIALLEIAYVLPGIVLAIACILLFLKPLPLVGVSLYATPWVIVFAYLARFLSVTLKPVLAGMEQIDMAQEEAAAIDGASLAQRLVDIVLPSLLPAAVAGGLMAFLLAFSELTVSALLWSAGTETIGVVLYNLEEAGLASQASAVAVVIVAVVTVAMLALDALGRYLPAGTLPWHCDVESGMQTRARPAQSSNGAIPIGGMKPRPALGT